MHVRKAIVTANLKGIEHTVEPVIPFNPPPGWDALSPTGLIPAMQDGDFTLAESGAICFYMERLKPAPAMLPADTKACSRVQFFDGYSGYVFRSVIHGLFFQKIITPAILKGTTDQSVIDNILATTQPKVFDYLESEAGGKFLVGDSLTLADIGIVSNLINYQYLGFPIDKAKYPKLAKYAAGIIALEPFQRALSNEKPFAEQMGLHRGFLG
ncbi:MAG: glutathione S-transferase family protein [Rhodospirillales bacterium]|nr:glutathione S-transferase family protein [Rhodospirillales bacterium]